MIIEKITVGQLGTNCYLFGNRKTKEILIIDPGAEFNKIRNKIEVNNLKPVKIILTHSHYDHIQAAPELRELYQIPIAIHRLDKPNLADSQKNFSSLFGEQISFASDIILEEEDMLFSDNHELRVIHTPGHSEGSIILAGDGFIFSGDLIFKMGIGRTDLPGGNQNEIINSLKKLKKFPDETIIYPGHGPNTDLKKEKRILDNF